MNENGSQPETVSKSPPEFAASDASIESMSGQPKLFFLPLGMEYWSANKMQKILGRNKIFFMLLPALVDFKFFTNEPN